MRLHADYMRQADQKMEHIDDLDLAVFGADAMFFDFPYELGELS